MGEGKKYVICEKELEVYRRDMLENERSRATIEKYIRDVRAFCSWNGRNIWGHAMRYPLPIPCLRL